MRTSQPNQEPTYLLASRALRFRVLLGDESGFAVTQRVGIGGAIFKASIVPPVGSKVRLVERYAAPGADGHIDAEVIAITPEPTLDGGEPGFCAVFQRFTVRGPETNLIDFVHQLEPGYLAPDRRDASSLRGDTIESIEELSRGVCTRFAPGAPFSTGPILKAAGLVETNADAWDEGLEEIDLGIALGRALTPAAQVHPLPPPAAPAAPSPEPPEAPRGRRGITAFLGNLFRRAKDDGDADD